MNYQSCCDWMFSRFPTFQKYGSTAFKPGLEKIQFLTKDNLLSLKEKTIIHVAGTNGKGSTSSNIASVLKTSGYRVGLFTSPHFLSFTERIQINGDYIPEHEVAELINTNKTLLESVDASFFEISLWLAITYFCKQKVDCIVLETGLGGRLDATNFLSYTDISVITNISLDHTQLLGDSIEKIAKEKGGIIKPNSICILGENHPKTKPIFEAICKIQHSKLYCSEEFEVSTFLEPQLYGKHQKSNAHLAYSTCLLLQSILPKITSKSILEGINTSQQHFFLPGRWQVLNTSPKSIFDMGHNIAGIQEILTQLDKENYSKLHIVWSVVSDKDVKNIFQLLPKDATYYFCEMQNPRGLKEDELAELGTYCKLNYRTFKNASDALKASFTTASSNDLIFCGGSAFLISELFSTYFDKTLVEIKNQTIFATVNN
ncbi:MAG: bifunctional folylpolyglutamate synthase/dihydrofolate synthase [Flavobacteriales bacterium]